MSEKSRSKDFDAMPAIKPAQDEVASYRRSGRSEAPRQSNFNGVLVFVIVLMAIMMVIGGYALWQVQQKLDQSNVLLAKGQQNMRKLEDRLSQTGDSASQKFQEMESQIKTNVSEIDKLWGVSYRTNKPNIDKNTKQIAALVTANAQLDKQLSQLRTSLTKVTGDFGKLASDMTKVKQDLATDSDDMATQVSLVRGQVQDQSVTVEGNKRQIGTLNKQLKDIQDAIKAIDNYRQQVNQRLIDLQSRVQGSGSTTGTP